MLKGTQAKVYDYLVEHTKLRGYPPSVREIGEAVGLQSSSTVHGHLERLEKRGFIRRDPSKPRAIELVNFEKALIEERDVKTLPLIGKVTAGVPVEANESIEGYLPISSAMDGSFFLAVQGDSMHDAGILNGDYVLVRNQSVAENGDVIVAKTPAGEVTVKKFFLEQSRVRLQPCNPKYDASYHEYISIVGKVVGLYRFSEAH